MRRAFLILIFALASVSVFGAPTEKLPRELDDENIDFQIKSAGKQFAQVQEKIEDEFDAILRFHNEQKQLRLDFERSAYDARKTFLEKLKTVSLEKRNDSMTAFNDAEKKSRQRFANQLREENKSQSRRTPANRRRSAGQRSPSDARPSPGKALGAVAEVRAEVREGDPAPDFSVPDQAEAVVSLSSYRGKKNVVLFFYPKDETRICTAEVCAFRDTFAAFTDAGAEVIGVSGDDASSHRRFADRLNLPFRLLSDENRQLRALYGVKAVLGLWPGRETFVIDRSGIIRLRFVAHLSSNQHVEKALAVLKTL